MSVKELSDQVYGIGHDKDLGEKTMEEISCELHRLIMFEVWE